MELESLPPLDLSLGKRTSLKSPPTHQGQSQRPLIEPSSSQKDSLKLFSETIPLSTWIYHSQISVESFRLQWAITLDLSDCQFFGSIPASLENLTQITSLSLDGNHFRGKIPNIFDNLRNLISLSLSWNNFSGQIPPSIGNLTNLYGLYFSHNQLEGDIPSPKNENGFSSLSFVR